MTPDELTDVTAEWLHAQSQEEPHKGGWLVGDCWMDRHSVRDHAETCRACRAGAFTAQVKDTDWVIVVARKGWSGSVPYSQPTAILAESYGTRAEAEAMVPADGPFSTYWVKQRMYARHLPAVTR